MTDLSKPEQQLTRRKITFRDLSPRTYEHPADRAALSALRKLSGFDKIVGKLFGTIGDRTMRFAALGSSVRVGPDQFTKVHDIYMEACSILDIDDPPELFVAQTPLVNAGAVGIEQPFIVLNSGTLGLFSDEELQFVIGHELGHVLSGHAQYKTMLALILRVGIFAMTIPFGGAAFFAISTALLEWDRKSELSADRCGLLVTQNLETALRVQMKMAGGSDTQQMNVGAFVEQAAEYESSGGVVDSVIKLLNLLGRRHPFSVLRLAELKKWSDSGEYQKVLNGEYAKRNDDDPSVMEDLRDVSARYKQDLSESKEPLVDFVKNVGDELQSAGGQVADFWRKKMRGD